MKFRMMCIAIAAAALCLVSTSAFAQTAIDCSTNAQGLAGDTGAVHTVICPAGCGSSTIWGTGTYSDDSSVCSAAIHAGVITTAGGTVNVTIAPGLDGYPASTANGITSSQWGSWSRSFTVSAGGATAIECSTNAQSLPGDPGTVHQVMCPAGCGSSTIWGTAVYSDDSSVCSAAIHNGTITTAGGAVTVTIRPGLSTYPSSAFNGITSSQWGSWSRSFTVGRPGGTCMDTCATAGDNECDDGGSASQYNICGFGTDCTDCGAR